MLEVLGKVTCDLVPVYVTIYFLDKVGVELVVGLQPAVEDVSSGVGDVGHVAGLAGVLFEISEGGDCVEDDEETLT